MKRAAAKLILSALLALGALRVLYTSSFGTSIVDAIPDGLWDVYHASLGLSQTAGVETQQNADAGLLLLVVCLPLAAALVWSADLLLKRRSTV